MVDKIEQRIAELVVDFLKVNYQADIEPSKVVVQKTLESFEGDLTLVVFPFTKITKKSPEEVGNIIGEHLKANLKAVVSFNLIKGFLNLVIDSNYYIHVLEEAYQEKHYGYASKKSGQKIMVEYSSPNTNKPLHLGHVRNNLLGYAVAEILKANGHEVIKTNLVNDRGIHICKTMLAWKKWGNNETPDHDNQKGDHYVGKYYVLFEKNLKNEIEELKAQGIEEDEARSQAPLMKQAQAMLKLWEEKDIETISLWKKMNAWVYEGFEETYNRLGVDFDKIQYESETFSKGKELVMDGLAKGVFFKKENNSVWINLEQEGLDEKLLLRGDGTSVYMTQDMGTALMRQNEDRPNKMIYVVGNEQDYHFNVLRIILKRIGYNWADAIYHMSYGMVDLPSGKMKSREGTVVDADDLMDSMIENASIITKSLGKTDEMSEKEANELFRVIGMGALKYFILRVDPKKNMLFNPEESIDFNGNTAPFIQYSYARIQSVLRKGYEQKYIPEFAKIKDVQKDEKELMKLICEFPEVVKNAGDNLSPALIANFIYELAKTYNQFYHNCPILKETDQQVRAFRLALSDLTARVIKNGALLLGIEMPNRM